MWKQLREAVAVHRLLAIFYAVEALICGTLAVLLGTVDADAVLASPYLQLGKLLRSLSEVSTGGNRAAWVLLILLALIPVAVLLVLKWKKRSVPVDWMLIFLSACLAGVLYWMVNPGLLEQLLLSDPGSSTISRAMLQALTALAFDTLLILYGVLRLLQRTRLPAGQPERFFRYFLVLLGAVLVAVAFGGNLRTLLGQLSALSAPRPSISSAILVLQYGADLLPIMADVGLIFCILVLLEAHGTEPFGSEIPQKAQAVSAFCGVALKVTVAAMTVCNLLVWLLCGNLEQVNMAAFIPLGSVGVLLAAMLLCRILSAGSALRQDNDLFI